MQRRTGFITLLLAGAMCAANFVALAGDLNPPAGPVAPTHKTLTEVEPRIVINATNTPPDVNSIYRITQPGSYYLAGNITGVSAKHGVKIASSGVTLDLMGFDLNGVAGSLDGVTGTGNLRSVAVVNGSIRNWGADGVDLGTTFGTRLNNLRVTGNVGRGLSAGNNAVVTGCSAYLNTGVGIEGASNGVMTECAARQNGAGGISVTNSWIINRCSSMSNTGDGINAASSATLSECTSTDNSGVGIDAAAGSFISGCTTRNNATHGIRVTEACAVAGNACYLDGGGAAGTGAGILATAGDNRIERNNCSTCGRGLQVDAAGNLVMGNSARSNGSNYEIVANNKVGIIVAAPNSVAISGSTGGAGVGTTDPWSNFSF